MKSAPVSTVHVNDTRISTGSITLNDSLGGGLRPGSVVLVESDGGAAATEFALTVLRDVTKVDGAIARFASATRSPDRVGREMNELFDSPTAASNVDFVTLRPQSMDRDIIQALADLKVGGCLVIESASALLRLRGGDVIAFVQTLGDTAARLGPLVVILHARGSIPATTEVELTEACDSVLSFAWVSGGPVRRQVMTISKIRGLAPVLERDTVPVFEVRLERGSGCVVSRVKSVI